MTDIFTPQLYLISPEEIQLDQFAKELEDALKAGNVAAFQLRLPNSTIDVVKKTAASLSPICTDNDVAFILCDDVELAKELACDGVHLESDCSQQNLKATRESMGDDAFIGVSVMDSKHNAMIAAESGADYISIGPIFYSKTKDIHPENQMDVLTWWASFMEVPCVAIGGLTPDNCEDVVKAGAEYIAAISGIWAHPGGGGAGVKAFNDAIAKAL